MIFIAEWVLMRDDIRKRGSVTMKMDWLTWGLDIRVR